MCSVRQSPMPSAPNCRARSRRRAAVSALARTFRRRASSAQAISVREVARQLRLDHLRPRRRGSRPCEPSMVIDLAGLEDAAAGAHLALPSRRSGFRRRRRRRARPMPRATTAAWLVMPPRAVTMPRAASMPRMSSGEVSSRTRITASPAEPQPLGLVGGEHDLAGGRAGRRRQALGDHVAVGAPDRWSGAAAGRARPARRASPPRSRLIRPSSAMSTATFSAALAVRLPLRVCSM